MISPLAILAIGVAIVLGLIIGFRINAFLALIAAALVVSFLAPGDTAEKVGRVAEAFGSTVGKIGIVIALASIIGKCMMDSGAADRIVSSFLSFFGEERTAQALAASGFVLSIPVFFDTVFYLLVPLARSLYRRTNRHYLRYLMAICAGAVATHTLVPPTPGPLVIAAALDVDLGVMIGMGVLVGIVATSVGMCFATWADRRMPIVMRPMGEGMIEEATPLEGPRPSLTVSLLPILLPVVLISANTVTSELAKVAPEGAVMHQAAIWTALLGNPNLALLLSTVIALGMYVRQRHANHIETALMIEQALMSSGVIILITAAGGAFGAMLQAAGIGDSIRTLLSGDSPTAGMAFLWSAFLVASLLKFSQGSSTVAMITASTMFAAMLVPETSLGYHRVYLAIAIGSGSLVGSWMNDSGFWIYSKMGGLTETETLKTWTPVLAVVGISAMLTNAVLATIFPMV